MNIEPNRTDCQIPCVQRIGGGIAETPPASLNRRLKLFTRRNMSPRSERRFKMVTNDLANWLHRLTGRSTRPLVETVTPTVGRLRVGDVVRVRPQEEIDATLNNWRQLKGCTFMPEMALYCGTTQRILKRVERFVDERDLRVKRSSGIVLLEGAMCRGTADFGPCDRCCFMFWREEWLEKIADA
jgi:hypothetical protein